MSKAIKQMQMNDLKNTFGSVRDLVFMNIVGLNAVAENTMRLALRKKGIRLQMVKNSLARRVLGESGIAVEQGWIGSTTVAWGGASIADLSKEVETLRKKHEKFIKVKTAVADGQEVTFAVALKMPTRLEAIGRVISMALAPASNIVSALTGPGATVASQIKTISEKKEEAPAAAAEAAPTEAPVLA